MSGAIEDALHRALYTARMMSWMIDPRFYMNRPTPKITRPIFLLGTQGGGLTLLARMLQRHPEVITAAGNDGYWTSANELQNVYGLVLPFELTGLRYKAPPHPVLTAPRSWTFATQDLLPTYRKTETDAKPGVKSAMERIIAYAAKRFARDPGRFRFLDKSQVFSVRAAMLHALFPDACFILVPREPYVSVYRAAAGKAGDMKRLENDIPFDERIRLCAEHYGNSMRATLEDADRLRFPLHILPFETLLAEPEKSLRAVCAFTGLDFNADMLPAAGHKLPLGTRFLDRWYPVRTDVNDVYKDKINAGIVSAVNRYAGDIIPRLGYDVLQEKKRVG